MLGNPIVHKVKAGEVFFFLGDIEGQHLDLYIKYKYRTYLGIDPPLILRTGFSSTERL